MTCEDLDLGRIGWKNTVEQRPLVPFGQRDLWAHLFVPLCDKRLYHMATTAQRRAIYTLPLQIDIFLPAFVRLAAAEHIRVCMSVYFQKEV